MAHKFPSESISNDLSQYLMAATGQRFECWSSEELMSVVPYVNRHSVVVYIGRMNADEIGSLFVLGCKWRGDAFIKWCGDQEFNVSGGCATAVLEVIPGPKTLTFAFATLKH
jgi:hypothetical protein